jgi:hypothetical protein
VDLEGQTIWITDAHGYGECFVVRADEKPTAGWNLNQRFAPAANYLDSLA